VTSLATQALATRTLATPVESYSIVIAIGGVPVRVNMTDASFLEMLQNRYAGFVSDEGIAEFDFDVELNPPAGIDREDVRVTQRCGPMVAGARGFSRRVGTGHAARKHSPIGEPILDRRCSAHRSHPGACRVGRISSALRQRDSQRESISVCRCFRRGEDDDLATGARGRDFANR